MYEKYDILVIGAGSAGLGNAGMAKIKVNDYFRSTNKKVYVLGDGAGKYMLSHGAEKMVKLLWRNMLNPLFKKKDKTNDLSWMTFTDPEVATFGYSEEQMNKKLIPYYRQDQTFSEDERAIVDEYPYGRVSIWMDRFGALEDRTIKSATMIAPKAGDLIQELQLAAEADIPIGKIANRVYPYPVASRINQKTIKGMRDKGYTPFKRRVSRLAFRMFN